LARKQKRAMRVYFHELKQVSRELDDVRSLTLSPELSDSLGRAQALMRQFLDQLQVRARLERGANSEVAVEASAPIEVEVSADRPYLAL
jgi:hypothetical protein